VPRAGCAPKSTLMNPCVAGAGGTCAATVDAVVRARHATSISVFVVFVINLLVVQAERVKNGGRRLFLPPTW
jgi:hypothetical protein